MKVGLKRNETEFIKMGNEKSIFFKRKIIGLTRTFVFILEHQTVRGLEHVMVFKLQIERQCSFLNIEDQS